MCTPPKTRTVSVQTDCVYTPSKTRTVSVQTDYVYTPPKSKGCSACTPPKSKGCNAFGGSNIKPQRTIFGSSTVSVVHSPKQVITIHMFCVWCSVLVPFTIHIFFVKVYQAFGMSRNATTEARRVWNKPFAVPIHEMSERTRSRALALATPAIEKMLMAFAGNHWCVRWCTQHVNYFYCNSDKTCSCVCVQALPFGVRGKQRCTALQNIQARQQTSSHWQVHWFGVPANTTPF